MKHSQVVESKIEEKKEETCVPCPEVIACETEIIKKNVHAGFICDGCEVGPIIGTRFKCFQCPDYDLCEKCEPLHHRHHIMLRIPDSEVLNNMYKKGCQSVHEIHLDVPMPKQKEEKKVEAVREETLPDLYQEKDLNTKIKTMKSNKGDTSINMKIHNNSKAPIMTVWVDYKGQMKHYATIKAGSMCNQQTYITHQWLLGDSVGPFAGYKPSMQDVSQLDYVSIKIDENFKVTVEEVLKKVEPVVVEEKKEEVKEEPLETETTVDTVSTAEKMLTELSEARKDKVKFREMAKNMLKSGEVDKELVKAVMADPKKKIKDVIAAMKDKEAPKEEDKPEEAKTEVKKCCKKQAAPKEDEYDMLKVSMIHEVMPGLDEKEVLAMVKANKDMDVNQLLDMLVFGSK